MYNHKTSVFVHTHIQSCAQLTYIVLGLCMGLYAGCKQVVGMYNLCTNPHSNLCTPLYKPAYKAVYNPCVQPAYSCIQPAYNVHGCMQVKKMHTPTYKYAVLVVLHRVLLLVCIELNDSLLIRNKKLMFMEHKTLFPIHKNLFSCH